MKQDKPNRKLPRLKGFDYKQEGLYFITICANERKNIFSYIDKNQDLENTSVKLSSIGKIVKNQLETLKERFNNIKILNYIIMPNHVHFIIWLNNTESKYGISNVVGTFKSLVAKECREKFQISQVFQRSFYDHIIRDEKDYLKIYNYIDKNPANWIYDNYYSDGTIKT